MWHVQIRQSTRTQSASPQTKSKSSNNHETAEEPIKIQETNQEEKEEEAEEEEEKEEEEEEEKELKIPRSILIDKHPHTLELCFGSPYEDEGTLFACDICNIIMDTDDQLYYCADCDFVLHLQCASPGADVFPPSEQSRNLNSNPKYPIPNPSPTVEMTNCVMDQVKNNEAF